MIIIVLHCTLHSKRECKKSTTTLSHCWKMPPQHNVMNNNTNRRVQVFTAKIALCTLRLAIVQHATTLN
ncbi:hypothetical protein T10_9361 [Trichinella papuae]|uniref:Uncharacterized protein n=1 Tax=Trichinella papuae TaxID=268474 RepID=A0A0V1MIZ8_9BILA|nr:hypothetical protein T10_9361 [Trichinella papuae]